jgi:putative tricarboxylic transport membrane protein
MYLEGRPFERFLSDETARVTAVVGKQRTGLRGASGYERLVLAAGSLALLVVAGSAWRRRRNNPDAAPSPAVNRGAVAMLGAALVLDVALIDITGFVAASTIMFVLVARAFGSGRYVRDATIGLMLAATIYVGFSRGLGVPLPIGRPFNGNLVGTR